MGFFDRFKRKSEPEIDTALVPGVGRIPYPAYRGREPYIFISYAHLDAKEVFQVIRRFNEAGFHVWYDEGISPGGEWADSIADALSDCAVFVVVITNTSAKRPNVQDEISYALDEGKPFLAIHLEETELPRGLKLRMSRRQAILKYKMTDEEFDFKYYEALTKFGLVPDPSKKHNIGAGTKIDPYVGTGSGETVSVLEKDTIPADPQTTASKPVEKPIQTSAQKPEQKPEQKPPVQPSVQTSAQKPPVQTPVQRPAQKPVEKPVEKPPVHPSAQKPVSKPAPAPAPPDIPVDKEHKWGSYVPKGTALIKTNDGTVYTAVANSLVFCPKGDRGAMLSGFEMMTDDGRVKETVYFSDIESVSGDGEKLIITDIDFDEYEIELKKEAEFWFIGEEDETSLTTVKASDVAGISFDRSCTPSAPIRYGRVTTDGGSFLSPIAYIGFHKNVGSGIPSLKFTYNISTIAPSPLKLKRVKRIVVTQNGREGTMFSASTDMEMIAYLKNGEEMKLVLSGRYDSFCAMSANGVFRFLSRNDLREILLDDSKDTDDAKPAQKADQGIVPDIPLPCEEHKWGSFIPKGTALIKTDDGTVHTAIADSLVFSSRNIKGPWVNLFGGLQTKRSDDGKEQGELIFFSDMVSVGRDGEKLVVTDVDGGQTPIEVESDAELWFIGEKDGVMPSAVKAAEVAGITFDRTKTPQTPIRYSIVTTEKGSFLSPVAFIWYRRNVGRGIPSMAFTKDFSSLAPSPLMLKRIKKITVTQNGKDGGTYFSATDMEMSALLRNGEEMKLVLSGQWDSFYVMSSNGVMRSLSRGDLKEIELLDPVK